jgi:hypothetical protein
VQALLKNHASRGKATIGWLNERGETLTTLLAGENYFTN